MLWMHSYARRRFCEFLEQLVLHPLGAFSYEVWQRTFDKRRVLDIIDRLKSKQTNLSPSK